jgi:hypothetical protein
MSSISSRGIPSESSRGEPGETLSELREMMEANRKNWAATGRGCKKMGGYF